MPFFECEGNSHTSNKKDWGTSSSQMDTSSSQMDISISQANTSSCHSDSLSACSVANNTSDTSPKAQASSCDLTHSCAQAHSTELERIRLTQLTSKGG